MTYWRLWGVIEEGTVSRGRSVRFLPEPRPGIRPLLLVERTRNLTRIKEGSTFEEATAMEDRARFAFGVTLNLGNYESLRVDASLESDFLMVVDEQTGEERLETYEECIKRLKEQVMIDVMTTGHNMRKQIQNNNPVTGESDAGGKPSPPKGRYGKV